MCFASLFTKNLLSLRLTSNQEASKEVMHKSNSLSYINAKGAAYEAPRISYVQSAISISWVSIRMVISQQRCSPKGAQRSFKRSVEGAPLMNTLLVLPVLPKSRKS